MVQRGEAALALTTAEEAMRTLPILLQHELDADRPPGRQEPRLREGELLQRAGPGAEPLAGGSSPGTSEPCCTWIR